MNCGECSFFTLPVPAVMAFVVLASGGCLSPQGNECASGVYCPAGYTCIKASRSGPWDCVRASCGDDILDEGESCDDGNNVPGDGCSEDCRSLEVCGDGYLNIGETCDDGNNVSGDGCSAKCRLPLSGVDIILVIDTSSSMAEEIAAVERNLNQNFADILNVGRVNYRLILIARFPPAIAPWDQAVCIARPLSGHSCNTLPTEPVNTERFFRYSMHVDSNDAFERILATFAPSTVLEVDDFGLAPGGWSQWLREESLKRFIIISDDQPILRAADFQNLLVALAPEQFSISEGPGFVWHSIIGLKANGTPDASWPPYGQIQYESCSERSVDSAAPEYQKLSQSTGGLRFPICNHDSFGVFFRTIAQEIVDSVLTVTSNRRNLNTQPVPTGHGQMARI